MSGLQVEYYYHSGKRQRVVLDELEHGHLLEARVVESARRAFRAAREAGIDPQIVAAWRAHGEHQDGCRLELYLGQAHDEFVVIAAAHGVILIDPAKPGHFVVTDLGDKTPPDGTPIP